MDDELPPPAYEEVVSSAPVPGCYNRLSRHDSLPHEAKRRLLMEVTNLRERTLGHLSWLRKLTSDVDKAYTRLKSNRSQIEREMYEWKVYLTRLVDECYQANMESVSEGFDTMEHKLVINREKVFQMYESSRQLCWSVDDQVSLRNHQTAQFLKRRFADKLEEIGTIRHEDIVPDRSISSWRFIKPEVLPDQVRDLFGQVWQPFMDAASTSASSSAPPHPSLQEDHSAPSDDISAGSTACSSSSIVEPQVLTGGCAAQLAPLPDSDVVVADSAVMQVTREAQQQETGRQDFINYDQKFSLVHTIQTKTFKDKARCHPISFAVDFDGNVIVADKFNQKLKIFTQRGQLFREITSPLLRAPTHIALTLAGDIAVSDTESADVKFYSTEGILLGNVPKLPNPGGIAFNLMGELLVTDTNKKAIHIVDTQVGVIKSTIQYYTDPRHPQQRYSYFQWPHYITTGHNDEIMVTDRAAGNYHVFASNATYLGSVGQYGSGRGEFMDPYGISTYMGHGVIVADYSNNRVQRLDADSHFHDPILTAEDGLRFPTYVTCTSDEKVLVSQYLTGEIKIFSAKSEHLEPEEALPPSYTDVVGESGVGGAAGVDVGSGVVVEGATATGYDVHDGAGYPPSHAAEERPPSWETSI